MIETAKTSTADEVVIEAFAKLDRSALGLAVGTLSGLAIFTATVVLLLKGGPVVGPRLALLGQYFIGYTVTPSGAFIGLVYGFIFGFVLGWLISFFRNSLMTAYLLTLKTRATLTSSLDSID
jgi:hypothetical protein